MPSAPDSRPGQFRTARIGVVLSLIAVLVLTGCSRLPLSGQVGESEGAENSEDQITYTFNPAGPVEGATQDQIVEGFITAATGIQNDFSIAKRFLTEDAAELWDPYAGTTVTSAVPTVTIRDTSTVVAELDPEARLSSTGYLEQTPEATTERLKFSLVEVDGEWRIDELADGIVLDQSQFSALYASHVLYFYDQTFTYAVPDTRWLLNFPGQSSVLVQSLLDGPAPYLKGAVVSAFGDEAAMGELGVTVNDGVAEVGFAGVTFSGTSHLTRQRMQQQVSQTLTRRARIDEVKMTVDLQEVELGGRDKDFRTADVTAAVPNVMVGVDPRDGLIKKVQGGDVHRILGLPDVSAYKPTYPTTNRAVDTVVFLDEDATRLIAADTGGAVHKLAQGKALTRPSLDPTGWAWFTDGGDSSDEEANKADDGSPIRVAATDGSGAHTVTAEWLSQDVTALRVSPDGTRVALVTSEGENQQLVVAGIVRDEAGVPEKLAEPMLLRTEVVPNHINWYSTSDVLVGETSDQATVELELIGLSGTSTRYKPLLGLTNFLAGAGQENIYAETPDDIYLRVGNNWRVQDYELTDLSYPG